MFAQCIGQSTLGGEANPVADFRYRKGRRGQKGDGLIEACL